MSEGTQAYLAKAHENLAGAEGKLAQGRYNSCARNAYFACFHAALAALLQAGLVSPEPPSGWGHDWVQARFVEQLLGLRHRADHRRASVSQRDAQHAVRQAQRFVQAVTAHVTGPGGAT